MEHDGRSSTPSQKTQTQNFNEAHREKALEMIFSFFAKKGGLSPLRKATFDEMRHNMTAIDLQEFLAFCKHYEVPLNSKV